MDKDLGPQLEPSSPTDVTSPWQHPPSLPSDTPQDLLLEEMARRARISSPVAATFQGSMNIEDIGSSPRRVSSIPHRPAPSPSVKRSSFDKPLPSLPLDGIPTFEISLRRNNSQSSSKSVPTLASDDGESEGSESGPSTPYFSPPTTPLVNAEFPSCSPPSQEPCFSPSLRPPHVISAAAVPTVSVSRATGDEHRRKHQPQGDAQPAGPELTAYLEEREQFNYIESQFFHKLPREDVPYMQSYTGAALDSDDCTTDLLLQLADGSPAFWDKVMPDNVLDLGCGRGQWAMHAVQAWPYARVTAFDIVNLSLRARQRLTEEQAQRIEWVQGNFLKDRLPFESCTFNLVRISCLSLAIPKERWSFVLGEAYRVLKPSGVFEVIDDELLFPSIQRPPLPRPRGGSLRMKLSSSFGSDSGSEELSKPGIRRSPTYSGRKTYTRTRRPESGGTYDEDLNTRTAVVNNMETIFDRMLREKFDNSRPHEYLQDKIENIVGAGKLSAHVFKVSVPKSDSIFDRPQSIHVPPAGPSKLFSLPTSFMKSRRPSLDNESARQATNCPAKALQILGEEAGVKAGRYQPPGFVVFPNIFYECDPQMLEQHACRSMHTVLSCKRAVRSYVQEYTNESDQPLVSSEEFQDLAFTYERCKRTRFNWPDADPYFEDHHPIFTSKQTLSDKVAKPKSQLPKFYLSRRYEEDETIHIRTIRVYHGMKGGPGSNAVPVVSLKEAQERAQAHPLP